MVNGNSSSYAVIVNLINSINSLNLINLVNVNVSEKAWKFVTGYKQPGESFAETLDRVLLDWKLRGDKIGRFDEEFNQPKGEKH